MSRITSVRSITRVPSVFSRLTPCTGDRPSSNRTSVARSPAITPFSSSTFPWPKKKFGVGASTRCTVRPTTWAPAVSARRASSSRCSSTCTASSLPLRGAPTSRARSIGTWTSISERMGGCPPRRRSRSRQEFLQRHVPRATQADALVPEWRVDDHRASQPVADLLPGDERAGAGAEPRPLEADRDHDPAVVLRREIERAFQQRVAEMGVFEIDAHLEPGAPEPVLIGVEDVEHEIHGPAGQSQPRDVDLLQLELRLLKAERGLERGAGG